MAVSGQPHEVAPTLAVRATWLLKLRPTMKIPPDLPRADPDDVGLLYLLRLPASYELLHDLPLDPSQPLAPLVLGPGSTTDSGQRPDRLREAGVGHRGAMHHPGPIGATLERTARAAHVVEDDAILADSLEGATRPVDADPRAADGGRLEQLVDARRPEARAAHSRSPGAIER
jgi:hypothetical protein